MLSRIFRGLSTFITIIDDEDVRALTLLHHLLRPPGTPDPNELQLQIVGAFNYRNSSPQIAGVTVDSSCLAG